MVRIHSDRPDCGTPPPNDSARRQIEELRPMEDEKKQRWPADAVAATYKYLSDGVRILAEAYSTHDDRNIQ